MSKIFYSMARSRMHFPSSGHRTGKLHICSMPSKAPPACWELTSTRNSVEQVTVSRLRDNLLCRTSFPTWTLTALAAYPSTSGWLLSQLALQERLLQQWSCKLTHGSSPFLLPFKASLPKAQYLGRQALHQPCTNYKYALRLAPLLVESPV